MKPRIAPRAEHGFVMLIALIMLLTVTLMVVTSSNLVQANLKVVQNSESRELARSAALAAIEQAISSDRFTVAPEKMFLNNCLVDNQLCFDPKRPETNTDPSSDHTDDILVRLEEPICVSVTPTRNSDLDVFNNAAQASCFMPPAVYSMCAYSVWDFRATATDPITGTEMTVRQGVSILTSLNKIDTACPTPT